MSYRTLAVLRRQNLITLAQRQELRNLDYRKVQCVNSVGDRVCILAFHNIEIKQVINELNSLLDNGENLIYPKSGKNVAFTLATFISFRLKRKKREYGTIDLPHHNNLVEIIPFKVKPKQTYLILDEQLNLYKIGRSTNPMKRERTLQGEKPTLRLVCTTLRDIEKGLHKLYKDKRVRGEWFKLSDEDLEDLKWRFSED